MKKWMKLPRIIEILGLIAVFIIIWFAFPHIEINGKNIFSCVLCRLTLIVSLLFIWLIKFVFFNVFSYFYAKKADSKLIKACVKHSDSDLKQEEEIEEKIKKIIKNIQQDFLSTKRPWFFWERKSIRKLPWFLVVGSRSSGKSSVICNAGLDVSYRINRGDEVKHDSGMFITHDAVFVEVERYWGDLIGEKGDIKKEANLILLNLLKELKKYRGKKTINGILLTVDISDVLEISSKKVKNKIAVTKRQLQVICENLNISIPFYFLFSKCDFISGFKEFFINLTEKEREQPWGISLPVDCPRFSEGDIISKAYKVLIARLNQDLFLKLQTEKNLHSREKINLFPAEMKLLQEPIVSYVKEYLNTPYIQDHLWARGIYFSSCSQAESSRYSLMSAIAKRFDLTLDSIPNHPDFVLNDDAALMAKSQVYFLDYLFKDIILQEVYLERKNKVSRRKRFWTGLFFYGAVFMTLIIGVVMTSAYYVTNENKIKEVHSYLHEYRLQRAELGTGKRGLNDILPVLNILNQARLIYSTYGKNWMMRFDPYQFDNKISKGVTEALYREQYKIFLPKIIARIEGLLLEYQNNPVLLNEVLQAYLVFGKYQTETSNNEIVKLVMEEDWKNNFNYTKEKIARLKYYLNLLLDSPIDPIVLNENLILQAAKCLKKTKISELAFAVIEKQSRQKNVQMNIPAFDLMSQIGPSFYKVFSDVSKDSLVQETKDGQSLLVSGFYTSRGFDDFFSVQAPVVVKQILAERKALNFYLSNSHAAAIDDSYEKDQNEEEQILEQVKNIYAKHYISAWENLLYNLKLAKFEDLDQAINALNFLEKENSVFSEVIKATKLNTSAEIRSGKIDVEKVFEPFNHVLNKSKEQKIAIENINKAISNLRDFLLQLKNSPKPRQAQFEAAKKRFAGELKIDPINELRVQAKQSPEPLQAWLYDLMDRCWDVVLLGAKKHVNEVWNLSILESYSKNLTEYYPLSAQSKTEIDLDTFSEFFGGAGKIEKFFKKYIEPFVDVSQIPWKLSKRYGSYFKLEKTTLPFFAQAAYIQYLYFTPQNSDVGLSFSIKPILLDSQVKSIKLDFGDSSIIYKHGPQRATNLKWSQKDTLKPIVITFNDFKGETYTKNIDGGTWSIFKLFGQSKSKLSKLPASGLNSYLFTVEAGGHQATFEVSSQRSIDAFLLKPLLGFKLPKKL